MMRKRQKKGEHKCSGVKDRRRASQSGEMGAAGDGVYLPCFTVLTTSVKVTS